MKSKKLLSSLPIVLMGVVVVGLAINFAGRATADVKRGKPEVKVTLSGTVERKASQSKKFEEVALERAGTVDPSEVLNWTILSENVGAAPARDYKTMGQIPKGTSFIAGSAKAEGAAILFSIDGGKSFHEKPTIEVKDADGSLKRVPAPISMYTQIKFEWPKPLAAGGSLTAFYQTRVK